MSCAAIAYSPVAQVTLSGIDESSLQQLKYHQLLKLASSHNVLKRWSKKEDLIKALLNAKSKNINPKMDRAELPNIYPNDESAKSADVEWRDAKEVFSKTSSRDQKDSSKRRSSGRLTFVVEKEKLQDSRGTYNLTKTSFPGLAFQDIDARLTFNVPKDAAKSVKQTVAGPVKSSLNKKLTVPMSARSDRRGQPKLSAVKESPLKLSSKSITIKKKEILKSPLRTMKPSVIENRLDRKQTNRRLAYDPKLSQTIASIPDNRAKSRASCTTSRRKSKSDDPSARRQSIPKPTFHSPPTKKAVKEPSSTTQLARTKLPNFAALHQRQFEKMDSLDDYMSKKTERIKKLFGTPTKALPANKENKPIVTGPSQSPSLKKQFDVNKRVVIKNTQLRTRTDVKDKTRSHIHGIRTNKRFELQMKFRNL